MNHEVNLSIVLPCYNEGASLPEILRGFARAGSGRAFELILVDNGSTDDSARILRTELARPDYRFARAVRVPVNVGYGHGIRCGLAATRAEFVAWSHADLQTPPGDVFRAFDLLATRADPLRTLVKGARAQRPFRERWTTFGMQTLARLLLGKPLHDINAQPKVFHRSLLAVLAASPSDWSFDLHVLYVALSRGWRIRTIPVEVRRRPHGTSKWAYGMSSRLRHVAGVVRCMARLRHGAGRC